ncbi:MAG: general secretion pathway protein GspB [Deltaproteobacteria bacterium]|nr:general secretion pathway protein GspB [Deltaproteobacteria bacterium]
MKRKHRGLITIGLVLPVLIAAAVYALGGFWKTGDKVSIHRMKPLPNIPIPETSTLREIDRLGKKLKSIAYPGGSQGGPVDLIMFGYQSIQESGQKYDPATYGRQITLPVEMNYSLTFAFSSEKERFCFVNNIFCGEGDSLDDGGRILKIEPGRVLIEKRGFKKWVFPDESKKRKKAEKRVLVEGK